MTITYDVPCRYVTYDDGEVRHRCGFDEGVYICPQCGPRCEHHRCDCEDEE